MSTDKHDQIMARTVPVTVSDLADLAHEANALQADVVGQADAVRYLRDSLRSSNDARAVLVDELHKLDDELRSERSAFGVMEQTALTLRDQLATETAKHARATRHIANMVTGQSWPEGRDDAWAMLTAEQTAHADARAEVARLTEGLASAHAAQGIVPLRFGVGDYVTLTEAHNAGVVGRQYRISEAKPDSSLPYYLGGDAEWVPESAVRAAMIDEPADEPRPFKVGDRVERAEDHTYGPEGQRGIVVRDDNQLVAPFWVVWDEPTGDYGFEQGEPCSADELRLIKWQTGERIEVGTEVEVVDARSSIPMGARGVVTRVLDMTGQMNSTAAPDLRPIYVDAGPIMGCYIDAVRRVS